jgi:biotin carboxyl carrier protein
MSAPAPEAPVNLLMGETLSILERLIVAPTSGIFRGLDDRPRPNDGYAVNQGDMIGEVRSLGLSTPIRSPFAGFLIKVLAVDGERVRPGQRVAWVRIARLG